MFGSLRTVPWKRKLNPFPIPVWMIRTVNKGQKWASIVEQARTGKQRQSHDELATVATGTEVGREGEADLDAKVGPDGWSTKRKARNGW